MLKKCSKGIIGDAFIIDTEIIAIFDKLKKSCQVITKELYSQEYNTIVKYIERLEFKESYIYDIYRV